MQFLEFGLVRAKKARLYSCSSYAATSVMKAHHILADAREGGWEGLMGGAEILAWSLKAIEKGLLKRRMTCNATFLR